MNGTLFIHSMNMIEISKWSMVKWTRWIWIINELHNGNCLVNLICATLNRLSRPTDMLCLGLSQSAQATGSI